MESYSTLSRDKSFRKKSYLLILFGVICLTALYGILYTVEHYYGSNGYGGKSGSSYTVIGNGSRGWSELLKSYGYDIVRDRGTLTLPPLDSDIEKSNDTLTLLRKTNTVVLLSDAPSNEEISEIKKYVHNGGRLITDNPYMLERVVSPALTFTTELSSPNLHPSNVDGLQQITAIKGWGIGRVLFKKLPSNAIVLTSDKSEQDISPKYNDEHAVANVALFRVGNGDVIALMDIGPVTNQLLTSSDNALFSLRIAGKEGSSVTFVEGIHGYQDSGDSGFDGMPLSWRIAIIGILGSFIIFGATKGRRFGVGEEGNRDLGPRRIYFAHALARALKKAKS